MLFVGVLGPSAPDDGEGGRGAEEEEDGAHGQRNVEQIWRKKGG